MDWKEMLATVVITSLIASVMVLGLVSLALFLTYGGQ